MQDEDITARLHAALESRQRSDKDTRAVRAIMSSWLSEEEKLKHIEKLDRIAASGMKFISQLTNLKFLDPHLVSYIKKAEEDTKSVTDNFIRNYNKLCVLIVDDLTYITKSISFFLAKENFTVYTAGSAMEAILLFQKILPDLLITDIKLPDINGLKLATIVRQIDETVPVIFISATDVDVNGLYTFTDNATYLQKPIMKEDLLQCIATYFKRIRPGSSG